MFTRFLGRRDWLLVAAAVILILAQIWMDLSIPEYMGEITDNIVLNDTDVVIQKGTEMLICALLSLALSLAAGFVIANISASIGRNMRAAEFERVQSFSVTDIERFSAASLITRSTNDVTQVQNFIARGLQAAIKCPIMTVWAVSRIVGASMEWTLLTVAGVLVLTVVMILTIYFTRLRYKRIQWLTDAINRSTRENLEGIRTIRAYNAESYQAGKFDVANGDLLRNNISAAKYMSFSFPLSSSMTNFVTLGIYWIGSGLILSLSDQTEQFLLYSDMIVFTSYATMVLSSINQFFGVLRAMPRAMVCYRRICDVVSTEPSMKDGDAAVPKSGGSVEFNDVSYTYPGTSRKALEGISFRVEPGSTFAVIGSTGAGKSTLVKLIERFYDPDSGTVSVDGEDVREYRMDDLRSRMGYVPQDTIIFSGTVRDNIDYGRGVQDGSDVTEAIRTAQAEDFISAMPDGVDSKVARRGSNLSGGQKQRISIARALASRPEIYLFDDSFSALDFKTEKSLRDALRAQTGESTVIIVAQRIGTVRDADMILVLDQGRMVGLGTHKELLATCQIYQDIARSQLAEEVR
ncbi:MAG: ABC transporter ATP-binding protein [Thermoplasmata archaeon]|nr:ABC transporter ATP-binding protein [Thermoplasmata archaeon]